MTDLVSKADFCGFSYIRLADGRRALLGSECNFCYANLPYASCPHNCPSMNPEEKHEAFTEGITIRHFVSILQEYNRLGLYYMVRAGTYVAF